MNASSPAPQTRQHDELPVADLRQIAGGSAQSNTSHLTKIVATNYLGQNAPSIGGSEGQYAEMWK